MFGILRGDIYRALQLRGNVFWYLVIFAAFVIGNVLFAALFGQPINDIFSSATDEVVASATTEEEAELYAATTIDMFANFSTATNFLGHALMPFGFMTMMVCWCVTNFAWVDIRDGYIKGLVSGVGKRAYFTEKLVFALVIAVVFAIVGAVLGIGLTLLTGIGFKADESVVQILVWLLLAILVSWGCAALCLGVLWIARNQVITYLVGFLLASGFLSGLLAGVIAMVPNMDALASAFNVVMEWLPRGVVSSLVVAALGYVLSVIARKRDL